MRIGLTGGIGSGKSTVASILRQLGAVIVDTDAIARQLTAPGGAAMASIELAFGSDLVTPEGALDRVRMREMAFADQTVKRRLESILHPLIGFETNRQGSAAPASATLVFDVPLLAESGRWRAQVDVILVVDCREDTQVERVVSRSSWNKSDVRAVVAQQATRAKRRSCADAVIYNDGLSRLQLATVVESFWRQWTGTSA